MKRRWLLGALLAAPVLRARAQGMRPDALLPGQQLRGQFTLERRLQGFANPLRSRGDFLLVPGQGLIWHAVAPFASLLAIGPGGIVQFQDGQEAMRLPAAHAPMIGQIYDVLAGALAGDAARLSRLFSVAWQEGDGQWRLVLTPPAGDDQALAQIAGIEMSGGQLAESVTLRRRNGDADLLRFTDQLVGPAAPTAEEARLLQLVGGRDTE